MRFIVMCLQLFSSVFKKDADEKGFAQYDELDEYYGEADEYSRPEKAEGHCPKWCMRCPTEKVGVLKKDVLGKSKFISLCNKVTWKAKVVPRSNHQDNMSV